MNAHYQVAVVGSGSAGKDAALLAARAGLRTAVIEAGSLGGTGLHRGCDAVRALRACATEYDALTRSSSLGLHLGLIGTDWANWLRVQRRTSARLTEGLSRELDRAKVEVKFGQAALLDPNELLVTGPSGVAERLRAEHIILAPGSRPAYPSQAHAQVLNTDQILNNAYLPQHLLVIGGGYVGCEFAAIHRALGARVTLVEAGPELLPNWDDDAGRHLRRVLEKDGVEVFLNERVEPPGSQAPDRPHFKLTNGTVITPDLIGIPARFDLHWIPRCLHTQPPIAAAGWTQAEAAAAEIVNLASTAIRLGLTARQLADLSLVHPSASEALVRVLQARYDRVHQPETNLRGNR